MENYKKSNSITTVKLNSFKKGVSNEILKCGESAFDREVAGQKLLNYLCDKFKIKRVKLYVVSKNRPPSARRGAVISGTYHVRAEYIVIYNLTAKLSKVVSIKSFYKTLLHEFIHYYDYKVIGLTDSLHTSGFYKRITDLEKKLQ